MEVHLIEPHNSFAAYAWPRKRISLFHFTMDRTGRYTNRRGQSDAACVSRDLKECVQRRAGCAVTRDALTAPDWLAWLVAPAAICRKI